MADIQKLIEEDKEKRKAGREDFRSKLLGKAEEFKQEGSPVRASLLKGLEWMMPEPEEDPDLAAVAGTLGGGVGKVGRKLASKSAAAAESRTAEVIQMLRNKGVQIADTVAESPKARQAYINSLAKSKNYSIDDAQKLADKFAPTTQRNITDVRVEGKRFSPEVREDAAKKATGKAGPKDVKVAEEIDYSGLGLVVKPRK